MKIVLILIGMWIYLFGVSLSASGQNLYPTAKGSFIRIDGGGINYTSPVTSGGWARGLSFYNTGMSTRYFGMGMMGSAANPVRFYLAYGDGAPWNSLLGLHILPNGNIGIGTINPIATLSVNGNILAKEIKVKTDIAAPDYVFESGYDLMSLREIETFINRKKHLPGVPSAKVIEKEGLDIAEMNLLLLQKIEELTLHLIEKEKELEIQSTQIESLLYRTEILEKRN